MFRLFKHIFSTILVASTLVSYSQTNGEEKTLLDSTSLSKKRIVILLETDSLIIFTTDKLFVDASKKFIKEHNIDEDKDLLTLFQKDSSKIVFADKIVKTEKNKSRLVYRIADLLESGDCLVYNKYKKRLEKIRIREEYSNSGLSGRKFKTKDRILILETVDGVF